MPIRLKEMRIRFKLTQKEVANLLNISPATYNRYEHGTLNPDIVKLCSLADFYAVSLDYLLHRTDNHHLELQTNK